MAKRRADKELTDRNWDQEDEPEEAGEIETASTDVMKGRQILKGKRRGTQTQTQDKEYSGFAGFSFKPTSASTPFSFNVRSVTNGNAEKDGDKKTEKSQETGNGQGLPPANGSEKKYSSYLVSLKNLNQSVLAWIQSHVDKNPFCILTPVFKDYEKHLEEIKKKKGDDKTEEKDETKEEKKTTDSKAAPSFQFGNFQSSTTTSSTTDKKSPPSFSFGSSSSTSSSTTTTESKPIGTGFQFGSASTNSTTTESASGFSGFSFKPLTDQQKPAFSFAANKPKEEGGASQEEDEEYVPPKPESKEVPEDGSVHSIKCKLFYQKDGNWTERGVGFLHLKPVDDKLQVVVRADTTLGNVLLNIILSPSIPLQRQGKNNVSLFCIPNPTIDKKDDPKKPVAMLIRVKTAEDADQLLEKMEELRKKD